MKRAVYIFRRDLRLEDNTALLKALEENEEILPLFIFNPEQINQEKNEYFSKYSFSFMIHSLKEVSDEIEKNGGKMGVFLGDLEEIIKNIIDSEKISAIYVNKDYTPFAIKRDEKIKKICEKEKIKFVECEDYLLNPPGKILKENLQPYTIFTPFHKACLKFDVDKPRKLLKNNFGKWNKNLKLDFVFPEHLSKKEMAIEPGRKSAIEILNKIESQRYYEEDRNFPEKDSTTHLSAHHKFGTISVRESYWAIAEKFHKGHQLITELYWRDFFTHIAFHFPYIFEGCFKKKYDNLQWNESQKDFENWCVGKTGFPIVDAGMRELNSTGFMHNRVRMICASFLVKDLHIDWRIGEKYFAQKLIDYDPSVNNGNWQWAASTGCDSQPYFRIFNPWLQQKKFDLECNYIKKWVPELRNFSKEDIHDPKFNRKEYPKPMILHEIESKKAIEIYKKV